MASVTFKRTNNIDSVPIVDGQLIFDTSDQKIYLDNGNTREVYGGGSGTDLISNVSDATDNNAFNANATVNLFTRKSSIVDTKAEIQSVTQAGVPLGCKGFNEVIGTGDISALGDGSVTGAILANKSAIDTVNQNLTIRNVKWDDQDDYLYALKNGVWTKSAVRLYLLGDNVFANGAFVIPFDTNINNWWKADGNSGGSWSVNTTTNCLIGHSPTSLGQSQTGGATIGTANLVDLTKYNRVVVELEDGTEKSLDISSLNKSLYITLCAYKWGGTYYATQVLSFTNAKNAYTTETNYVLTLQGGVSTSTTINIRAIYLE